MDTDAVLTLLQDVAEAVINPRFRRLEDDEIAEKAPGDLVTDADVESERLITDELRAAYPDAVVLGEEASSADPAVLDRFAAADHAFTVDPLDGTKNFVHGSPDHAVMASELRGGVVVRAWIWQPQHRLAYVAEHGAGAFRNGDRLVRPPVGSPPRGVTSRRRWIGRAVDGLPPLELTWVSCGVDYPKLAEGAADYLVYSRTKPWDHAPGGLILREAGGVVGTFDNEPYDAQAAAPRGLVASADRATYDRVRAGLDELIG